ncbi:MAG: fluoride efflux transporter FluC [Acidimicrobiales bacterium]
MELLRSLRYVAAGGVIGALCRWGIVSALGGDPTGAGMLAINVVGSLILGVLVGASAPRRGGRPRVTTNQFLLVGTGFCGAFTSFSSYALDVARNLDSGTVTAASLAGFGTAVGAVVAAGVGYRLGSRP